MLLHRRLVICNFAISQLLGECKWPRFLTASLFGILTCHSGTSSRAALGRIPPNGCQPKRIIQPNWGETLHTTRPSFGSATPEKRMNEKNSGTLPP